MFIFIAAFSMDLVVSSLKAGHKVLNCNAARKVTPSNVLLLFTDIILPITFCVLCYNNATNYDIILRNALKKHISHKFHVLDHLLVTWSVLSMRLRKIALHISDLINLLRLVKSLALGALIVKWFLEKLMLCYLRHQ